MITYLWVAVGAALGGVGRYWLSGLVAEHIGETFPWGTLVINVTGSFVIGFFAELTGPDGRVLAGTNVRQFVMTGFCGGYTTFSSFSLETVRLLRSGEARTALLYIGVSVVTWLVAVWPGHTLAARLNRLKGS